MAYFVLQSVSIADGECFQQTGTVTVCTVLRGLSAISVQFDYSRIEYKQTSVMSIFGTIHLDIHERLYQREYSLANFSSNISSRVKMK